MIKLAVIAIGLIVLGSVAVWYWLMVAPLCKGQKTDHGKTILGVVYKKDQ